MYHRWATPADSAELAVLNRQLVREGADFGSDDLAFLQRRMHDWLANGDFRAVIFHDATNTTLAYALFREQDDEVYLAQFLVLERARRHGVGAEAIRRLRNEIWRPARRLTLEVLINNRNALDFWHANGWRDCAVTLELTAPTNATRPTPTAPPRPVAA